MQLLFIAFFIFFSSIPVSYAQAKAKQPAVYEMVRIPAGSFTMGGKVGVAIERPLHTVIITRDFYMGKTEVTQRLFTEVMGYDPVEYWGDACLGRTFRPQKQLPVYCVSWYEAVKFANALSRRDGLEECYIIRAGKLFWPKGLNCTGYRLPTEAEWEYAAKSGTDQIFAGGNNPGRVAWYWDTSNKMVHPVGKKKSTVWGVHDLSGNVWEWVWDFYGDYPRTKQVDPSGPDFGEYRVRRGGSWFNGKEEVRSGGRLRRKPRSHFSLIGFRLVRTNPIPPPPKIR